MTTNPPEPPTGDDDPGAPPPPPPPPPTGGAAAPPPGAYAEPPPSGYGAAPPTQPMGYGMTSTGGAAMAGAPLAYADWGKRALSGLIDFIGPSIVAGIFYQISSSLGLLLNLAALAWAIYNAYLGGQTGQSYGKKIAGTRLISEATGLPPGGGLGIGRYFVHILDGIPCYLGFLWPLWDAKRQTFADKILKTAVVTV